MFATKQPKRASLPILGEVKTVYMLQDIFNAIPSGITIVNKIIASEIEKWRMSVVNELNEAERVRVAHEACDHDAMVIHARERFLDEKQQEIQKMNWELNPLTAEFIQQQNAATERFFQRYYGEKIK